MSILYCVARISCPKAYETILKPPYTARATALIAVTTPRKHEAIDTCRKAELD